MVGPNNEALYFRDFELNNEFLDDSLFMNFRLKKSEVAFFVEKEIENVSYCIKMAKLGVIYSTSVTSESILCYNERFF